MALEIDSTKLVILCTPRHKLSGILPAYPRRIFREFVWDGIMPMRTSAAGLTLNTDPEKLRLPVERIRLH
jgi:hypothetical protein